ncbi:MAG: nucleoside transporter C-terminal domain-containing protein [Bradymonadales bacterium]|jgi:nucleoside transporter
MQHFSIPRHILRYLSYALVALCLILLTLGIMVRDEGKAVAQDSSSTATIEQTQEATTGVAKAEKVAPKRYLGEDTEVVRSAAIIAKKRAEDSGDWLGRLLSIFGVFFLIGIAWLMSDNRGKIKWKLVGVGVGLQLLFAVFILWTPVGKAIFNSLNTAVTVLLDFTKAGTEFMFTSHITGNIEAANINTAMSILPPIIFFSSLMTVLYHLGVMQLIVRGMAGFMMKVMGVSGSESLSAVANIFVGQTEAPLVVKPYVERMTRSELMAIMTGGFATIAGGIMAAYVAVIQPYFPDIAGHLIAASVMSAPAALVAAKIMVPETQVSETYGKATLDDTRLDANAIDAAARGATDGIKLAINVFAMLIAFIAIIAMINFLLGLPSRINNAQSLNNANAFLVSSQGSIPEGCDAPYSSSDNIVCTHKALIEIAKINAVSVPPELATLPNDQFDKIERTNSLSQLLIAHTRAPLHDSEMLTDCRAGVVSACGAVLSKTQSELWSPELKKTSFWPMITLEFLFGWIFFPIAWLMGVPLSDCFLVGQLLGEKIAINEFIAYLHLADVIDQLHYRSIIITTYALCGFANFGSIAIQLGGIGAMAPSRRSELAKLGMRAMIAGTLAAFMTATIAGALV